MTDDTQLSPRTAAPTGLGALVRTFVRAPLDPASWRATLAVLLGAGVAMVSMTVVTACFSTGGSLLLFLVGIPVIGLGIEFARAFARLERWRMAYVDRRPTVPHRYRPLDIRLARPYGPWVRSAAEAVFLDANRWRDVIYVLILFPLAFLESAWWSACGPRPSGSSPRRSSSPACAPSTPRRSWTGSPPPGTRPWWSPSSSASCSCRSPHRSPEA